MLWIGLRPSARNFGATLALSRYTPGSRDAARQTPDKGVQLMGLFSKDIKSMDDLFLHTLQDVYYA